jgi:hypothetical protein
VEVVPQSTGPAHRSFRLAQAPSDPPLTDRAFLAAWVAFVVLSAVDCLTTVYGLSHRLYENNPVAAHLYADGGAAALWAFKFAVLGIMLPLLARLPRRLALTVAAVLVAIMWLNDTSNLAWILSVG